MARFGRTLSMWREDKVNRQSEESTVLQDKTDFDADALMLLFPQNTPAAI
jgi:hypothetical protein